MALSVLWTLIMRWNCNISIDSHAGSLQVFLSVRVGGSDGVELCDTANFVSSAEQGDCSQKFFAITSELLSLVQSLGSCWVTTESWQASWRVASCSLRYDVIAYLRVTVFWEILLRPAGFSVALIALTDYLEDTLKVQSRCVCVGEGKDGLAVLLT